MMPEEDSTPSNPKFKVHLRHLDSESEKEFLAMKDKYPKLYNTQEQYVGKFTITCRQKQRKQPRKT